MTKRKSPTFKEPIICSNCKKSAKKVSAMQNYCEDCSKIKDKERKAKWYQEQRKKPEIKRRQQLKRERGALISKGEWGKGRAKWLETLSEDCPQTGNCDGTIFISLVKESYMVIK